jgi:hypothetical protein
MTTMGNWSLVVARTRNAARNGLCCLVAAILLLAAAGVARGEVSFSIQPVANKVAPGAVFDVELTLTAAGSPFNGFDAYIGYDPAFLIFLEQAPADQQGPLMQGACSESFYVFDVAPDSTSLEIHYFLLCSGVSVTGPGVVFRLRFEAKHQTGDTDLTLLAGTAFYLDGLLVTPVTLGDATITIGTEVAVPGDPAPLRLELSAAPNPFNARTELVFDLARSEPARLAVYTAAGRRVVTLLDEVLAAGRHRVPWNGLDAGGRPVASGVYAVCLQGAGWRQLRSVTLVK